MTVDTIVTQGALAQNCYIISAEDQCIIIDPGAEPLNITSRIAGKKVMAILLTHRHVELERAKLFDWSFSFSSDFYKRSHRGFAYLLF